MASVQHGAPAHNRQTQLGGQNVHPMLQWHRQALLAHARLQTQPILAGHPSCHALPGGLWRNYTQDYFDAVLRGSMWHCPFSGCIVWSSINHSRSALLTVHGFCLETPQMQCSRTKSLIADACLLPVSQSDLIRSPVCVCSLATKVECSRIKAARQSSQQCALRTAVDKGRTQALSESGSRPRMASTSNGWGW
jgi:hypothetical protein